MATRDRNNGGNRGRRGPQEKCESSSPRHRIGQRRAEVCVVSAAVDGARADLDARPRDYAHIVRLEHVEKFFGAVHALRDISLAIGRNEIVGLIGDNGAGKSTLIKVMTGVLAPTAGRMFIRDRELDPSHYSVRKAHDLAIETVYQDRSLADKQPLWRNFFVGRQIANRFGFIDVKREKEIAGEILLKSIGFRGAGISVDSTVAELSGGERQGIAIGRAMHYDADLIVLDEPTAALAVKEVRKVLDFVRRIKESGRACVYIEHNLAHVHEIADRLVILDRGRIVSELRPADMSVADLTDYLISLQQN
jgi:simple sugar transport system ATP-binding protein